MDNVFFNYKNQNWEQKELIIILNNNNMNIRSWRNKAKHYKNISIYRLPQKKTLGKCLNFAIRKAKYPYIAKLDDDDYYAPNYLKQAMSALKNTNASIVGKRGAYIYFENKNILAVIRPDDQNKFIDFVHGATMVFEKKLFDTVKFPDRNRNEDFIFQKRCRIKGFKVYCTDQNNYVCIRRKNKKPTHGKIVM